ncbi:replication protein [Fictibacillus norfolkensis]|uniref:Replication protein n=1 Tax=Fictibacillus norfolkensis TaxID=2762233 RepID=A0ABR8SS25_9BACL|nr:replication protein [Fictibacillus norfolkensis]MBD7966252.1 replication protein [Fictibacillus norfolkensis]
MADVQPENGFTKIANEILEEMQKYKFNLNEVKVIMCLWRFTYGFQRKKHNMSLSFIENHTGLTRTRVNNSLKNMIKNNVVMAEKGAANKGNLYSFNKNYDEWKTEKYSCFGSVQNDTSVQGDTSVQNDTTSSVQDDTTSSVRNDTQERKDKEISKEKDDRQMDKPNPFSEYEKHFGISSAVFKADVDHWMDNSNFKEPEEIIVEVIRRSSLHTPRNPAKYINTSLSNLHKASLFTLQDVLKHYSKNDRKPNNKKPTSVEMYSKRGYFSKDECQTWTREQWAQWEEELQNDPDLL